MFAEDRRIGIMRVVRFAGLAVVGLIAFAGSAQPATAFQECYSQFMGCFTPNDCVTMVNRECYFGEECQGVVKCMPGFGCESPTNVAAVCYVEDN